MYLSLETYTDIQMADLKSKAGAVGQTYLEYYNGALGEETLHHIVGEFMQSSAQVRCIITDKDGSFIFQTLTSSDYQEEYKDKVLREINSALMDMPVERDRFVMADGNIALSVCEPIKNETGTIVGSVFLLRPFSEVQNTHNRLNMTFFRTVLLSLPLMLLISSLGVRKFTYPINKMADVAIKMRNGDFEARADETATGELGLLARSLNELCKTLSQTIHQLRAEKSQLKQILSSFSEGVAATDSLGCLTHYNTALMQMFGNVRVDTRLDLIPDIGIWEAFDEVNNTGEATSMRYPLPGDRMLWITLTPVVTEDGERTGVVGLFKDMTEVENLDRTRREYVANVSHEMRTPLTAMRGLLEPLSDGLVTSEEDKQRYYKIMMREVLRLSRLITDMLQLSRLQSGTEYMELIETDVEEILTDVIKSYGAEASQRKVSLKLDIQTLPHVLTDPDRVEQVLIILVDNALRYTGEGGVITLKAEAGERVNISVADTGAGIPEEDIPHIFERFYTVDKSRKEGGTGLGLSIAQHIIMKLGENIEVQSKVGEGTCFMFTLKKYVRNAIALGPPSEDWDADFAQLPPLLIPRQKEGELIDADYEVLPDKGKKQPERKRKQDKKDIY